VRADIRFGGALVGLRVTCIGWEHGHVNMLAHFIDAVANGTAVEPLRATFLDGLPRRSGGFRR